MAATSGKYDFRGIKQLGAKALLRVIAATPWGAALMRFGAGPALEICFEWLANWLANKGLVFLNIGAISAEGAWDQKAFDAAVEAGLAEVAVKRGKLTPEQEKAIDDKVRAAARRFLVFTR